MNQIGWALLVFFLASFGASLLYIGIGAVMEGRKAKAREDLNEPIYLFHRSERPSA